MRPIRIGFVLLALTIGCRAARTQHQHQSFDSKGVWISYTDEGKGEPVVLIHGLGSSANVNWRLPGAIKLLAPNYRVIALDCRGHGNSGKPESETSYGVEMAEDLIRLMDHLKVPKAHIVGYSMGGMIALKLATRHPDRIRSLVLGGMGWLRQGSVLQAFWARTPGHANGRFPTACAHSLGDLAVSESEVKAVRMPVSILVGDHDPVRRLYVDPLKQVRPDWPVMLIEGAGHLNCVVNPQFREGIKKSLDSATVVRP